jgi:hypothetical protein
MPVVGASSASSEQPAGIAADSGLPGPLANLPVEEHPEILVGAAFAGGIVAAFILKRLGR